MITIDCPVCGGKVVCSDESGRYYGDCRNCEKYVVNINSSGEISNQYIEIANQINIFLCYSFCELISHEFLGIKTLSTIEKHLSTQEAIEWGKKELKYLNF